MEIRIEFTNKDNSHSWVRISHGLNKLVTDLNYNKKYDDNEQESNARAFASRSTAKAKPQRRTSASSSTKTILIGERTWTDIEPEDYSSIAYPVSKQLSTVLRHGHLPGEDEGAIKDYLRNEFVNSQHWSDEMWKSTIGKRQRKQEKISILY